MFGPQSAIPLMKALDVDSGSRLAGYPPMWRNLKPQDASNVLLHTASDDSEPSLLLRGNVTGRDAPNHRPSDNLERDQFPSTLFPFFNNPRNTSPRTLLSAIGVPVQSFPGVSDSTNPTPQRLHFSTRPRHGSLKRASTPPQSPSLPTVAPTAVTSCKRLQPELTITTGFWRDIAENKYVNTQEFWLALYFFFNLSLTLYNKVVLVHFPYPYTVTALHALCGTVGGWSLLARGFFVQKRLSTSDTMALVMFSVLYSMNIAISNVSLNLVTVPFHQVVRAATPIFTIILSSTMFGSKFTTRKVLTLIPVILGVGLATYGDYYFTVWGLILTLLGTFLAALKTIYTNVLQSRSPQATTLSNSKPKSILATLHLIPPRLAMHPLDLLTRMGPLAFIQCMFCAWVGGELKSVRDWSAHEMSWFSAAGLLMNGCIAFGLNIVSFTANKKAGALSMTVAANIKQVLTILFAVFMFDLNITNMNTVGILFTLVGGAWYGYVDFQEKRKRASSCT